MYVVHPITVEKLWGDTRLHNYSGNKDCDSIGIVYTVSGIPEYDCTIENKDEITTLYTKMQESPETFGLSSQEFPVIIAFDACKESVSFQIHPTDDYAKEKLHLPYGKSEVWYFIEKPSDGWIYAENPKESLESVIQASQSHNFEGVVDKKEVQEQDCIYIRSGTIHALTKGSLIYEIQQSTNITYRLYDYDRIDTNGQTRPLHLQESYDNLEPSQKIHKQSLYENETVNQREFTLKHQSIKNTYTNNTDVVVAISLLKGEIHIESFHVFQGQSILVLPFETIEFTGYADVILAWPNEYYKEKALD